MKSMDNPLETIENLGNGFQIIQGTEEFRYGTDAVKLADFVTMHPGDRVMDFCTGTGIVPLLLAMREPNVSVVGLEIQEKMQEMASRSIKLNSLTDKITIQLGDVKEVRKHFEPESFQIVTCNPPYMKDNTGKQSVRESVRIARHELCCNLYDCIESAAYLLPSGGKFYMVHRPERLTDILSAMRDKGVEPKRLTLYAAGETRPPRLLVVEGQKNRKSGLIVQLDTGAKL